MGRLLQLHEKAHLEEKKNHLKKPGWEFEFMVRTPQLEGNMKIMLPFRSKMNQ